MLLDTLLAAANPGANFIFLGADWLQGDKEDHDVSLNCKVLIQIKYITSIYFRMMSCDRRKGEQNCDVTHKTCINLAKAKLKTITFLFLFIFRFMFSSPGLSADVDDHVMLSVNKPVCDVQSSEKYFTTSVFKLLLTFTTDLLLSMEVL